MSEYIKARGINYAGALLKIKKKNNNFLQPIYEAITNSLEAIKLSERQHNFSKSGEIKIKLFVTKELLEEEDYYDFYKIDIIDNGVGFNDKEFNRLIDLNDQSKGFLNKGTGRIQFLHSFGETQVTSVYKDDSSTKGFKKRKFTISKSESFLNNNAIIRLEYGNEKDVEKDNSYTTLTFKEILLKKDKKFFNGLTVEKLKESIIKHYLVYFCENRNNLPKILIEQIINENTDKALEITSDDIPKVDKKQSIDICYCNIVDGKIKNIPRKETFNLRAFKISEGELSKNELKLVSKGEIAKPVKLDNLLPDDQIENNRYLFFLSGEYIDNKAGDTRGEIKILTEEEFKTSGENFLKTDEILLENIERKTNDTIIEMYDEIKKKHQEKLNNIEELKNMFLLNQNTIDSLKKKISINDTDDTILKKVYEADAKIIATRDAEIKKQIKDLNELDTTDKENYSNELQVKVDELVKIIPQQNRTALTRYVARRKLVLDLFKKILNKEIKKLKDGSRIGEALMHNLIFQQSTDNPEDSDLWLINEDFIYFKGFSEYSLDKLEIDGEKVFKEKFKKEEKRYLNSLGEKRLQKCPDILLFPEEGKCIIIEFKAPDINVSLHLTQINFYANLIRNYTYDKFKITTFYGYLIGESIEGRDVIGHVSSFEYSYNLDYWFCPSKNVSGFDGRSNGSLYTEVIKYSTLLKRALIRNKIFIDKIMKPVRN